MNLKAGPVESIMKYLKRENTEIVGISPRFFCN